MAETPVIYTQGLMPLVTANLKSLLTNNKLPLPLVFLNNSFALHSSLYRLTVIKCSKV